jgi:glycosyltransferase involved in cell wall biosynthesis
VKVGIISYFFPPNNSAGAQRWSKLALYLKELGAEVFVISAFGDKFGGEDEGRFLEISEKIKVYPLPHFQPYRFPVSGKGEILKFFLIPDGRLFFFLKYYGKIREILQGEKPDVVVITAPPFSAFLTIPILSRLKIPFVADLRDVWISDPRRKNKLADFLLERWALRKAKAVFCINDPCVEEVRKFNEKVFLIPHFYDPREYRLEAIKHQDVWVSHVGSIFHERNITHLISACKKLNFTLRLVGPGSERWGGFGPVSRRDALREMVSSDVLIAIYGNDESQNFVSSVKLFEYLGAGKPIVVISPRGYLREIAQDLNLGICENSEVEIMERLKEAMNGKYYPREPERYSIDVVGRRVFQILQMIRKN